MLALRVVFNIHKLYFWGRDSKPFTKRLGIAAQDAFRHYGREAKTYVQGSGPKVVALTWCSF